MHRGCAPGRTAWLQPSGFPANPFGRHCRSLCLPPTQHYRRRTRCIGYFSLAVPLPTRRAGRLPAGRCDRSRTQRRSVGYGGLGWAVWADWGPREPLSRLAGDNLRGEPAWYCSKPVDADLSILALCSLALRGTGSGSVALGRSADLRSYFRGSIAAIRRRNWPACSMSTS
jgi:hypothetical protein